MSRFSARLRLALESDGAGEEEVIAGEDTSVDLSVTEDIKVEQEEVEVTRSEGETEEEVIAVDGASDPAAGTGEEVDDTAVEATDTAADDGDVEVIADTDDVIVDTSDSAEEAVSDANAAEAEVDSTEEQKEELEEATAGLEAIYDLMVQAQQTGGLTPQSAKMATLAVESYTARCGDDESVMASLEHFGGDSTRMRATSLSLESIGEKIKHYWKVVWDFVAKLKTQIWNFIKNLFAASAALAKRGARLANLKLSGSASKPKVDIKGYAKKIAIGTRVTVDPMAGLAECQRLVTDTVTLADKNREVSRTVYEYIAQVAAGKVPAGSDTFAASFTLPKAFTRKGESMTTEVMPGNVRFVAEQLTLNDGKIKLWKRVVKVNEKANVPDEANIPTMTPDQIVATGEEAVKLHAAIIRAQDVTATAVQKAKALKAPSVSDTITGEQAAKAKGLLSGYRAAEIFEANLTAKVCSAAVNAALAYLKVAEQSAKLYGATSEKSKDEKPAAAAA